MTQTTTRPRRIRVGTIVWGAIVVAIAIFAILILFFGPLGQSAILWTIVGFGSILILGAIVAGVVGAARRRPAAASADAPPTEPEPETETVSTDRLTQDSSDAPLGDN